MRSSKKIDSSKKNEEPKAFWSFHLLYLVKNDNDIFFKSYWKTFSNINDSKIISRSPGSEFLLNFKITN